MPGLGPSESFHLPCSPGTMNSGGAVRDPQGASCASLSLETRAVRSSGSPSGHLQRHTGASDPPPPQLLVPIPWWDPEMWAAKKLGSYLLYSNQVSFKSITLHLNMLLF